MASEKRAMDVSQPGDVPASPTARPVIVGHGPMMKDPMVFQEEKAVADMDMEKPQDAQGSNKQVEQMHEKVIQPSMAQDDPAKNTDESIEPKSESIDLTGQPDQAGPEVATDEVADIDDTNNDTSNDAVVDAVIEQVTAKKKSGDIAADKAQQEHIEKLVADKTYFVPIGQVAKRRNRRAILIVLVVLVITLIAVNFALDAGYLNINGVPYTDIIP